MTKKKKLEDGLNRLFSSPRPSPEPAQTEEPAVSLPESKPTEEKKTEKKASAAKATKKTKPIPFPPTPNKAAIPVELFDDEEVDISVLESELQSNQNTNTPAKAEEKKTVQQTESPKKSTASQPNEVSPKSTPSKSEKKQQAPPPPPPAVTPSEETSPQKTEADQRIQADEQIVMFTLNDQLYGINIALVTSIIKMQSITIVPRAPHYIEGVTNLRGNVVPVINLHKRLELDENQTHPDNRIVVVDLNGITAGMIVDNVNAVTHVEGKNIDPASHMITNLDTAYVKAIAQINQKLVILLELEKVLQPHRRRENR